MHQARQRKTLKEIKERAAMDMALAGGTQPRRSHSTSQKPMPRRQAGPVETRPRTAGNALAGEQAVCVALRLLERLAPATDDAQAWAQLPDEIVVYRAGSVAGLAWTTSRETADGLARKLAAESPSDAVPVHAGTVAERDVLAHITGYGEDEIVVRREHVNVMGAPVRVRTVPTPVPTAAEKWED